MSQQTITPLKSFTGYPNGQRIRFAANVPVKVSAEYAELLANKGLIEKPKASKKTSPDEAE